MKLLKKIYWFLTGRSAMSGQEPRTLIYENFNRSKPMKAKKLIIRIHKNKKGQYWNTIQSANGQVMWQTEMYKQKNSAVKNIVSTLTSLGFQNISESFTVVSDNPHGIFIYDENGDNISEYIYTRMT